VRSVYLRRIVTIKKGHHRQARHLLAHAADKVAKVFRQRPSRRVGRCPTGLVALAVATRVSPQVGYCTVVGAASDRCRQGQPPAPARKNLLPR
jgi:hypothetical protein